MKSPLPLLATAVTMTLALSGCSVSTSHSSSRSSRTAVSSPTSQPANDSPTSAASRETSSSDSSNQPREVQPGDHFQPASEADENTAPADQTCPNNTKLYTTRSTLYACTSYTDGTQIFEPVATCSSEQAADLPNTGGKGKKEVWKLAPKSIRTYPWLPDPSLRYAVGIAQHGQGDEFWASGTYVLDEGEKPSSDTEVPVPVYATDKADQHKHFDSFSLICFKK